MPRLVAIGLLAGLFSALFGVGGGVVMVPLLLALLDLDPKHATATSLATIVVTSAVGAIAHGALGNVDWARALLVGIPAMAGLLLGLLVKDRISSRALVLGFAGLLAVVAICLILRPGGTHAGGLSIGGAAAAAALGLFAGVLAGLFGVGGGILFVPALTLVVGLSQVRAEATSLLAIIPVALLGSWRQHRAGLVLWHDVFVMGAASAASAVAGAVLAEHTPGTALRLTFAALLLLVAAQLGWRALGVTRRPTPMP